MMSRFARPDFEPPQLLGTVDPVNPTTRTKGKDVAKDGCTCVFELPAPIRTIT